MNPPRGMIGILAAFITFLCVGIPLHEHGMPFLPALFVQLGVMTLIIVAWIKIEDKINKRKDNKHNE
jgi:hypothetical protein